MAGSQEEINYWKSGFISQNKKVLHDFYAQYFHRISKYVRDNSGNEEDARDLFQEAIMVLFEKFRDPAFTLSSQVYTYFFSISRNLWLKKLRNIKRQGVTNQDIPDQPIEDGLSDAIEENARYHLFRVKLTLISEQCQELMKLAFQGLSIPMITDKMGMSSEGYTRKRKFQCKEKLIQLVKQDPNFKHLRYSE